MNEWIEIEEIEAKGIRQSEDWRTGWIIDDTEKPSSNGGRE
jgi:hypothetical protein